MNNLKSIQKTFALFEILIKIAKIICIIIASICVSGALCAVVWYNGGKAFSILGEDIIFSDYTSFCRKYVELLSSAATLISDSILLAFAQRYLKTELAEGTPFTENGALELKKLGIRCIYIPVAAAAVMSAVAAFLEVESTGYINNLPAVATGVVLTMISVIFRYGAQLEKENRKMRCTKE